ncbi:MAG: prepilin-type N-terminal cleavage/methylation domain-containing protein [Patescibacteria group bacterium]
MDQKGFSLKELLIVISLVLVLIVFGVALISSERAKVRDARRMADLTQVRFGFEVLFQEKNSYAEAAAGCSQVGNLVSACSLGAYLADIASIKDPGRSRYQVTVVPNEENYEVTFFLEKGYDSLKKGKHTLSAVGIR